MARTKLEGLRVAVLAADGFEQVELTAPMKELRRQGAVVEVVSIRPGQIKGMHLIFPGKKVRVDRLVENADPDVYDALLLPGGFVNPDLLRQNEQVLEFVRAFDRSEKPIAVICHGPWVLASAGLIRGRRLTSWPGIKDDLINAGADWFDAPVVRDNNWVSSRGPHDLKAFKAAMVELFAERTPLAPKEIKRQSAKGRWLVGGMLLAGVGYALRYTPVGDMVRKQLSSTPTS